MGFNFVTYDVDCAFAMPQDIREWLPAGHLCWKVIATVRQLDLTAFLDEYRADGQGRAAYDPSMLLSLVVYCYSKGVRSSRRIESACLDDLGCRIITTNRTIDHSTIARFIQRHRQALKSLFVQVLAACGRHGLVDPSAVAIDGSPMKANASRDSNRSTEALERIVNDCGVEVTEELEAESNFGTASGRYARLCDRRGRAHTAMTRLVERARPSAGEIKIKVDAAERVVARANKRLAAEVAAHQARLDDHASRRQADTTAGRRGANGRPPVPLESKTVVIRQRARLERALAHLALVRDPRPAPSSTAHASLNDPDSRLMVGKHGGYVQGYNVQIACARRQVLLAIEMHDNPADMTALVPMVRQTQRNCRAAGVVDDVNVWLADNGYASAANFDALAELPLLVAVTGGAPQLTAQPDVTSISAAHRPMADRLATPEGRRLYKRRAALVEPGFAQLFQRFGRDLHYRGRDGVDTEVKLLGLVHNLNKLFRHTAIPTS